MSTPDRLAWGHTLTEVGVLVRRASAPVALLVGVVVVLATAPPPSSFEPTWIVVLVVAAFLAGRLFAVGLAALGWMVFPPDHRTVLAELASHATLDG